ncbi:MAG: hypothetical protein AB9834_23230 [Lentimicrobium sp.]
MKLILTVLTLLLFSACNVNYPVTSFYVKNTSGKTINFKASILKYSSMGQCEMTLPFAVAPHDSTLARRVGFHKDAVPTAWFRTFVIFPTDSVLMNDPNNDGNWIKSTDKKGKHVYTFTLTK